MFVSLNWLKQYVDLPADLDPADLALRLTMSTVEVEGWRSLAASLDKVIVGQVKKIEKHPDADRLQLVEVDIGREKRKVVCGGKNLREDMFVAFALPGAKVRWHGEGELIELTAAVVRGVKSTGMICAAAEIGLADIFPAPDKFSIIDLSHLTVLSGQSLSAVLGFNDVIFEIDNKSLTNRPDLWGHYGLAREVAAIYGLALRPYPLVKIKSHKEIKLKVKVPEPKLCLRYLAAALKNVTVADSPAWLKERLLAIGQKPINNIVDITNYVMFDLGQPVHAFGADKIKNHEIIVRRAKSGEKIKMLDGQERLLIDEDLVIADRDRAIALAGIMGAQDAAIASTTKAIIIESANFNPVTIRKTANRLGLRTEAAIRFEKSLDPHLAEVAVARVLNLLAEIIPDAEIASEIVDEKKFTLFQGPLFVSWNFIEKKIGQQLAPAVILSILERLGFSVKKSKDDLRLNIPSWRATKDISTPEDIVEEIARIYGYDNLVAQLPVVAVSAVSDNKLRVLERRLKQILCCAIGANEIASYSFVEKDFLEKIGMRGQQLELENPWANRSLMRDSLIPGLLQVVADNQRFYQEMNIFEVGKVFLDNHGDLSVRAGQTKTRLPQQDLMAAGAIFANEASFFMAKGTLETLAHYLNLSLTFSLPLDCPTWVHPRQCLQVIVDKEPVGLLANLHPEITRALDCERAIGVWQLNLNKLLVKLPAGQSFVPPPKFPSIKLDLSIVVDEQVAWKNIYDLVINTEATIIKEVQLLDVFKNDKIEVGKKSVTLRITYQATDRTLSMAEAMALQERIARNLERGVRARLRC